MNILGFGQRSGEREPAAPAGAAAERAPARSLARVSFPCGGTYAYYNDRFDLRPGDCVFVDGRLQGQLGVVTEVTEKFKISLADYKKVLARADPRLHGAFFPKQGYMVGLEPDALPPERFRSLIRAPYTGEKPPEIVVGAGYCLDWAAFEQDEEVRGEVAQRARDICRQKSVGYLALRDGVGTAFVEGTAWYEVNFRLRSGRITDLYCECPYMGLCKHSLAALFTLRALLAELTDAQAAGFTAVERDRFLKIAGLSGQPLAF